MKVYVFEATDEQTTVHATLEGAKAQWERVKSNFLASEKHIWLEDGLDGTVTRIAVRDIDIDPDCDNFDKEEWVSSAWIFEMEVQD